MISQITPADIATQYVLLVLDRTQINVWRVIRPLRHDSSTFMRKANVLYPVPKAIALISKRTLA